MPQLKTLIVDDTVVYRKILSEVLSAFPEITLLGTAPNGDIALKKIALNVPDLVFLDVHMPGMDGVEVLRRIQQQYPSIAVVMISSISSRSTADTVEALQLGAVDFIRKPDGSDQKHNTDYLSKEIKAVLNLVKIRLRSSVLVSSGTHRVKPPPPPSIPTVRKTALLPSSFSICVIGISTGGPEALGKLIPALPFDFPLPVLIVQHMPPMFTRSLADSLNKKSKLHVTEAGEGDQIAKGTAYIAPGGKHMIVRRKNEGVFLGLNDEPPENSCRPSVDVLFRSVAAQYPEQGILALVLTGMGNDGLNGVRALKRRKCYCLTQSASSCVVYGMPRAVDEAGLTDRSFEIEEMAEAMNMIVRNPSGLKTSHMEHL
ncbi:MAG: chemotaxis-specific protein-glutamate methyltransferase CheB [Chitinispirillaceae bacterium]